MEMLQKKNSILLYGMNCINHVWHVVPAPLYVLPASAMTLKTMIQAHGVTALPLLGFLHVF